MTIPIKVKKAEVPPVKRGYHKGISNPKINKTPPSPAKTNADIIS